MGDPLDGLTGAQRSAATRSGPLLLIAGVPGSGKTELLARRVCWLAAEHALAPHRPLIIARDLCGALSLRGRIEDLLDGPHEALNVLTIPELCTRLVDEHSRAAGIDELTSVLSAAERLALLLERVESLELRYHDYRGRPLALLAGMVRRIDRLKSELVDVDTYASRAGQGTERDREFAAVYEAHEQLLREHGAIDAGGQLLACVRMFEREPELARELAASHPSVLVDDWDSLALAARHLIVQLAAGGAALTATGATGVLELRDQYPTAEIAELSESLRCTQPILDAAAAAEPERAGLAGSGRPSAGATVAFWRCSSVRAQARRAAVELEQLTRADGVDPSRCAVLVRSIATDGPAVAEALSERGLPYNLLGTGAFFERSEVRDVLAWLRLLADPRDAAAVVRALTRPPIELHAADVARCVQLARRRKLDMVSALEIALASPQLPPEARERIASFLEIQRSAAAALDEERSDLFVHGLIERLGLRRRQLFSARADVVDRLANLGRLEELASRHQRSLPGTTPREFALYAAAVAESGIGEPAVAAASALPAITVAAPRDVVGREFDHVLVLWHAASDDGLALAMTRAREHLVLSVPTAESQANPAPASIPASDGLERARLAAGGEWEEVAEELFGPTAALHALFGERRDELLDSVSRVGARLGELRFDTDIDVTHSVVRLLELIKLAALLERRAEEPIADALADINARLAAAATPLEREILLSSPLDELLTGRELQPRARGRTLEEPSLAPFLPRRGDGLVLSATDVDAYRSCPLRYKFARVLRVPREPTLNQRFGIVVHQVLERYHQQGRSDDGQGAILALLDTAWRRGGFGDSAEERQLREKARSALVRYQARLSEAGAGGTPRWFERSFSFHLGPHIVRGRVDRIDELADGGHELIDYKTGPPKRPEQLSEDVQLALYSLAAREAWQVEATERTYYYVLDDVRIGLGRDANGTAWVEEAVAEVGEGILAQRFEPTPSRAVCALCDYRIACPAAEY